MDSADWDVGLFVMGGTIDSRYAPERDGEAVVLASSLVSRYLKSLQLATRVIVREICLKDSRSVTDDDREKLRDAIAELGIRNNLITHGTYTMWNTGVFLENQQSLREQVIGLTGAMAPLIGTIDREGRLMPSDGQFNLGYSLGQLPSLQPGVYQFMNGSTFRIPEEWWKHTPQGTSWSKGHAVTALPSA